MDTAGFRAIATGALPNGETIRLDGVTRKAAK